MKCEICNEEAVYRFSPDLDIDGLGGCEKHKESVQVAYYILINIGEKEYKSFLKSLQKTKALESKNPSNL